MRPEFEDVVDDHDVAAADIAAHVAHHAHLAFGDALAVVAREIDEVDLGLEPLAVQCPDEVGGEDEAPFEHGDHHEVVEASCGNVAGELIDAGGNGFGAVERLDRAVRPRAHDRHPDLAK